MALESMEKGKTDAVTTTAKEENPRLTGLALMLDDGTRKSHSVAQNSAFVSGFFKGLSTRDAYKSLITSLYFVYSSMEEAFDDPNIPGSVSALDDAELRRLSSLEKDMDYFYGGKWRETIQPSPATKTYVARICEIAAKEPYLLIAHQYTRYLGDLFGGQMMGGMATRSLELEDGKGVAFYTFDEISNNKDFITDWYQRLNNLNLTEKQKNDIVDEANHVFDLNIGILQELEGSPLKAVWTLAINTLKMKLGMVVK
jgi:heme oxygenase